MTKCATTSARALRFGLEVTRAARWPEGEEVLDDVADLSGPVSCWRVRVGAEWITLRWESLRMLHRRSLTRGGSR